MSTYNQYKDFLSVYLRRQKGRVIFLAVLILLGIGFQLISPQVIRYFIDTAAGGGEDRFLLLAAGAFIAISLAENGLRMASGYLTTRVSWTATNALRKDLILHSLRLDMDFHKVHTPDELIERIDGDVSGLANYLSGFVVKIAGNLLLVVGILALLWKESLLLGAGLTVFTIVSFFLLGWIARLSVTGWKEFRQASGEQYGFLEERISGAEDIRSVGGEEYTINRLYYLMRKMLEKARKAFMLSSLSGNLTDLMFALGYAIGLGLGIYLYTQQGATIGTAYLVVSYVGMLSAPVREIRGEVQDFQQSSAVMDRIQQIMNEQPRVISRETNAGMLPSGALPVRFEHLTFHYETDDDVLKDIHFELEAGKVLGILGRTGSGKTTLSRLLFRLYDPVQGAVLLGGCDLRSISLDELRRRVGIVTQDVQLFAATVRQNLTFFDSSISDEKIQLALEQLGLWSWVSSLPKGLDTWLGSGGQGLSAGEAQLLAFARVFLKDPALIILDEASSRLDPATEALLERAIDRLFAGRTGILIAHRLGTIQRAEQILILENGAAVEWGERVHLSADRSSRFYGLLQTGLEEALA